jgi:hypothetical protein
MSSVNKSSKCQKSGLCVIRPFPRLRAQKAGALAALLTIEPMVDVENVAGNGVFDASAKFHNVPRGPAADCAAAQNKSLSPLPASCCVRSAAEPPDFH